MVGEIRVMRWTRDWVMTGQPVGKFDYEFGQRQNGELFILELWTQRDVAPASQIVSQTTTEAN